MKSYRFTFQFIGSGENEKEALQDAIEAIALHMDCKTLEPNSVKELSNELVGGIPGNHNW